MNRVFFLTGAESTGKSSLTMQLAGYFGARGIPEFARTYLEGIGRPYTREDVEIIAKGQAGLIRKHRGEPLVFFDTCLIIIKVWFREVYGEVPPWLDPIISGIGRGTYLLCEPDLPWEYDPLRENPHRREYLNLEYEKEIKRAGFDCYRISGSGQDRLECAIEAVNGVLNSDIGT